MRRAEALPQLKPRTWNRNLEPARNPEPWNPYTVIPCRDDHPHRSRALAPLRGRRSCASMCGSRRACPEVTGSLTSSVGVYRIDRREVRCRASLLPPGSVRRGPRRVRAGRPGRQDPTVQFYTAYSYLRQGWGRVYDDDALSRRQGDARRAPGSCAPHGTIVDRRRALKLHSAEELDAEFDRGLTHGVADLNPMRLLRERP